MALAEALQSELVGLETQREVQRYEERYRAVSSSKGETASPVDIVRDQRISDLNARLDKVAELAWDQVVQENAHTRLDTVIEMADLPRKRAYLRESLRARQDGDRPRIAAPPAAAERRR